MIKIRSKSPLRLSFGGGGTDVEPYVSDHGGSVINATITRYAYGSLEPRDDNIIRIKSLDLDLTARYDTAENYSFDGKIDLATAVLNFFKPEKGADISLFCDAPPGSGLGSSSTVMVTLIGLFNEWLKKSYTSYEVSELAYKLERIDLGLEGGKQDQYASSFGGFNFIEFEKDFTIVNPLKIPKPIINELEYRSVLAYTGGTRLSANIIKDQKKRYKKGNNNDYLDKTKSISIDIKNSLLTGNLKVFGNKLNDAWKLKKGFSDKITSEKIDLIYNEALKSGALGGKITGAGGGGFFYCFCEYDRKHEVIEALKEQGCQILDFNFDFKGLQHWRIND